MERESEMELGDQEPTTTTMMMMPGSSIAFLLASILYFAFRILMFTFCDCLHCSCSDRGSLA